jgi:hypothetical protein
MAREEDIDETEEEEEEEAASRPSRPSRSFARRGGGGGGFDFSGIVSFASRHRVPLMVGGGFLLAYWVGHRRGKKSVPQQPVIYNLPSYGGQFRTGIQSTSMYDPRFYDLPEAVDTY